jgi:S1-C subfamily serine protease
VVRTTIIISPSDDENLINYPGEVAIMNYIVQLVQRLDDKGKLNFIKTKEENNEDAPRFKVTLGVVPDYGFDGAGMRIDGVSENKPAAKAGLKAGDIVTQIGEEKVVDMMSYMKALGKFSKGDTVQVKIIRDKVESLMSVTF